MFENVFQPASLRGTAQGDCRSLTVQELFRLWGQSLAKWELRIICQRWDTDITCPFLSRWAKVVCLFESEMPPTGLFPTSDTLFCFFQTMFLCVRLLAVLDLLCTSGWPRTHRYPPASVLGLKTCATMPCPVAVEG